MEALVQRVDERLAIGEVHVERALRDAGLRDDAVDAQAGEAVLLGDDACRRPAAPRGCGARRWSSRARPRGAAYMTGRSHRHDRPVGHVVASTHGRCSRRPRARSPTTSAGTGPPIVLLPSGAHDHHDYDELRALLPARLRSIALDWPAHGPRRRATARRP